MKRSREMAFPNSSDSEESEEQILDLYHYSSKANIAKIMRSKVIKQSTGPGDILLGKGVYFTTLSPCEGKEGIKQNNWDDNSYAISDTKVQAAIKVSIPSDQVKKCITNGGREIYMKPGDVDLRAYPHQAYEIEWDETSSSDYETSSSNHETYSSDHETYSSNHETYSSDHETCSSDHETYSSNHETSSSDHETFNDETFSTEDETSSSED